MSKSLRRQPVVLVLVGLASMVASLVVLAAPAGAHRVTVGSSIETVCGETGLSLSWQASTWTFDEPRGLHPNIIIEMGTDVSAFEVIANGPFTDENGRSLSGTVDIPAGATQVELRAFPDPDLFWEGTDVVGLGDSSIVSVPSVEEFCGASPPEPTPTEVPEPTATPEPTPTPTPTVTPTPEPTVIPEPTPTPTTRPEPTPTSTPPVPPTSTPAELSAPPPTSASLVCATDGIIVSVEGAEGDRFDVFVDGALSFSITIPASGTATADIAQAPGQTNEVEVRDGATVLVTETLTCVEGGSSPGEPTATPAVLGKVELPETGAESGLLTLWGIGLMLGGAMMTVAGVGFTRRLN